MHAFGEESFPRYHYVNFEKYQDIGKIFEENLEPARIISEIELLLKRAIDIEHDLVIFDEIQACPKALTSLKYFCEDMPELALCAAGSLLGIHLNDASFPVGKVDWIDMYPLSFEEFLMALGEDQLLAVLANSTMDSVFPDMGHQRLWDCLKCYFIVGGLPEVVTTYLAQRAHMVSALAAVREKQEDLIRTYYADIAKHAGKVNAMHIDRVWQAVPTQLATTQNGSANKFKFKGVVPGVDRYRRLVNVIDWLVNAGLIIKVKVVDTSQSPLSAYAKDSSFKLFIFDVGLLGAMSGIAPALILKYDYGSYKGYFAENFVCQELYCVDSKPLYSWQEKTAEIEFLKEFNGSIIPIEVKSGSSTRAKSLKVYAAKYQPNAQVILSANKKPESKSANMVRLPLYMTGLLKVFLD